MTLTYSVDLPNGATIAGTDATLTWDMVQPDGQVLAAADIKTRTATVLQGRFATLCTVQQALDRAAA